MIEVLCCPICQSADIIVKKKYHFKSPFLKPNFEEATNKNYADNRLAILFGYMLSDRKKLNIDITQCDRCSFIFFNPTFTESEIVAKYARISEVEVLSKKNISSSKIEIKKKRKRAKRIYNLISNINASKGQSILDYGGAQGDNLFYFKENNYKSYLIDYVKYNIIDGVEYLGKDFKNLDAETKFDIILCCHTLEHVVDPAALITNLSSKLTNNGLLYIEVPLGCWREWKRLVEPITHLNFFSEESLYKLSQKLGLQVVHLSSDIQWVGHLNSYCINLIIRRSNEKNLVSFMLSKNQEQSLLYYLKFVAYNPKKALLKFIKPLVQTLAKAKLVY